jgi:hypothetical protein
MGIFARSFWGFLLDEIHAISTVEDRIVAEDQSMTPCIQQAFFEKVHLNRVYESAT